jgi:hypothetical protein
MSKHTPGPWRVTDEKYECRQIKSADGKSLMGDEQYYPWTPADIEDWHLIAAAPELLEFVKEWLSAQGDDNNHMTAKARAAIAKAEGAQ